MTVSGSNLISITGNHGSILRSLREYLGLLEGGGFGQNRALTSRGGVPMIGGLVPSNTGDVGGDDLTFSPGVCRASNSDGETAILSLTASMNKLGDTAWSKGTGAGMLDTGAISDTVYHDFLIGNPQTREVDILRSLSATAPTMPSGWTYKRRIFSSRRVSGANQVFTAVETSGGGLLVQIAPVIDSGLIKDWGGADDTEQTGASAVIPTGVQMLGHWAFHLRDTSAAAGTAILVTSFDQANTAPVVDTAGVITALLADAQIGNGDFNEVSFWRDCLTRASDGAIRFRLTGSTVDHSLGNTLHGWTDFRVA